MSKQERGERLIASNKRARHDFQIFDTYEAGMVLTGSEVKSLRMGRASLAEGFIFIENGEAWLESAYIPEYLNGSWTNHAPRRKRKLLLHHHQIDKLFIKTRDGGMTIVPLKLYFLNGRVKVQIALAKGKREYDKRQTLREQQDKREAERAMRQRNRMGE
ncbi:MAG: SsrA-binding protein SmpB [Canibacter sp.]